MTGLTTAERLGIPPGGRLWFSPMEWMRVLGPLPPGVAIVGELAEATVAIAFVSDVGSARWLVERHRASLGMPRVVWVCYPTRGRSDFNRGSLNSILLAHGLQVVAELPFDASWTALHVRHFAPTRPA